MPKDFPTIAKASGTRRPALTLLELLVVLVILVILTAVAVESTSAVVDQGRYNATQQTLQNVQDAIVGPTGQRSPDGSLLITGFVSDMGRLPQPAFVSGAVSGDPLRELWDPTAVALNSTGDVVTLYGVQTTASTGLTNYAPSSTSGVLSYPASPPPTGYTSYNNTASAVPVQVSFSCGWRGPYLQLPVNNGGLLLDGWGNPFQSLYQIPGSTTFPVAPLPASGTTPAQPINVICSLGADGAFDTAAPANTYNEDQYIPQQLAAPPVAPLASFSDVNRTSGTVSVVVKCLNTATSSSGSVTNLSDPLPVGTSDAVEIVLFEPVNGVLTPVYGVNLFAASGAPNYFPLSATAGTPTPNVQCTFSTTVGARAVQAFQFDMPSGSVSKRSPLVNLMIPPGGLSISQTLILQ